MYTEGEKELSLRKKEKCLATIVVLFEEKTK
jgi:hypothetical protein